MNFSGYMKSTYMWLCISLVISAISSWLVVSSPTIGPIFLKPHGITVAGWIVTFLTLGIIFFMNGAMHKCSVTIIQLLMILFSICDGISTASLMQSYTATSIFNVFIVTAGAFGLLSLYGAVTRRNLGGMATLLLFLGGGIVIAGIVNMFLHSSPLNMLMTLASLILFGGMTVYSTQQIRTDYEQYAGNMNQEDMNKMTIMSAMSLYINFMGLFTSLLQLFGNRED